MKTRSKKKREKLVVIGWYNGDNVYASLSPKTFFTDHLYIFKDDVAYELDDKEKEDVKLL